MKLLGVMEGHDEDDECVCGHTAMSHSPCCGACQVCGTRTCDEFSENGRQVRPFEPYLDRSAKVFYMDEQGRAHPWEELVDSKTHQE